MNKTIIININGIVFHIEEDAYEVLKNYMTDVKRHFMNSADSLEITTDIENRIAEMFNELLAADNKQVIVEVDVRTIIEQMGTVQDFENADEDAKETYSSNHTRNANTRRLFRDPDDHLVAGVCSGIANYFDIDPVWIRLAFGLSAFFAGSGVLVYIILWIVIPKAITRADRMAMKGEKLNLEGFKKNFEEELGSMKNNLSNFGREAKPFVYQARDFISDFFHHFGFFVKGAGQLLIKLLGVFILLCCFSLLIFTIVAFVALIGIGTFPPFHDLPYNLLRHNHAAYIYTSAFLVAFIPLLSLILITLKGIFNSTSSINKPTGSTFLVIWIFALATFVYYVTRVVGEFSSSQQVTETISLTPSKNNVYYLKMNDLKYFSAQDSARLNIKSLSPNIKITENPDDDNDFASFTYRNIHLSIERSDTDQPVLIEDYKARGRNDFDALNNARNIKYVFTQQDTTLKFDYRLYPIKNDLWHNEEVYITLKLPLNAKVIIDESLNRILDNNDVDNCKTINKQDNAASATFIMNANGLQCKVDTLVTGTGERKLVKTDSIKMDSIKKMKK